MEVEEKLERRWLLLSVALVALGVVMQGCFGARDGAVDFGFIGDTARVRGLGLARGADSLLLRRSGDGPWMVGDEGLAEEGQVHSLLEILRALRLGVELSDRGSDSLRKGIAGEGLQVRVEYETGGSDAYTLFLPRAKRPCVYSPTLKRGWTVDLLGFDESFIGDLSLRQEDWCSFVLGVRKPSDLRGVELVWRGDMLNSFAMRVGDGYATRVVSLADSTQPVECDTARVSVFLHSLTSLRSFALSGYQRDSLRAWIAAGHYDCALSLQLEGGDTLRYELLFSAPFGQGDSLASPSSNEGYLRTGRGEVRRFFSSDWDVTLLPLRDLLRENRE